MSSPTWIDTSQRRRPRHDVFRTEVDAETAAHKCLCHLEFHGTSANADAALVPIPKTKLYPLLSITDVYEKW